MKRILVLGGVSYNLMIDLTEFPNALPQTLHARKFHEAIGSTGAGKALALRRLGVDVSLHGVIGEDSYGEIIKKCFHGEDIPFFYDLDPKGTERHVNLMKNESGERISIFLTSPAADILIDEAQIEQLIKESDLVILNIAPYCKRLIPLINKYNKETWCDLHSYDGENPYYDEFIRLASVVLFSSERCPDYRKFMRQYMATGKQMVICTHGVAGSTTLLPAGQWVEMPSLPYEVVDTNGAGDNFFAGVVYGYLQGYDRQKTLQMASIAAGLAVTSEDLIDQELSVAKVEKEWSRWFTQSAQG